MNEDTLFRSAIEVSPGSAKAQFNYAQVRSQSLAMRYSAMTHRLLVGEAASRRPAVRDSPF